MHHIDIARHRGFFKVIAATRSIEAATMILKPGEDSGEFGNEHPGSEQWLLVLSGTGRARVKNRRVSLREGSLLLIEKGERHQIKNAGCRRLVTINFYSPPAYSKAGDLRPAAKR